MSFVCLYSLPPSFTAVRSFHFSRRGKRAHIFNFHFLPSYDSRINFSPNVLHLFPIVSPPSVSLVLVFPLDWHSSVRPFQKLSAVIFFWFLHVPAMYTFWAVLIAAFTDCLLCTDSACCCWEGFVLSGLPCSCH